MVSIEKKYGLREYKANQVVSFRKTKEAFGGLSNMCSGYPLNINGHKILTSEAIYQACRFPDLPNIQQIIINERSPMTAKMKSKPHRINTRADWDSTRIVIMRWALQVKLAQNFLKFGKLLEETHPKQIVEDSRKDKFWGAVRDKNDENSLIGVNALGRLLMELRQKYMSENRYDLLIVQPLHIDNFKLFGEPIKRVDERINFVNSLIKGWKLHNYLSIEKLKDIEKIPYQTPQKLNSNVNEPLFTISNKVQPVNDTKIKKEEDFVKNKILLVLKLGKAFSSKDLVKKAKVDWKTSKMTAFLKKLKEVDVIKGSPLKFKLNQPTEAKNLFSNI
ncbi:MAG: NADAR family protein [Aureispira sp.]